MKILPSKILLLVGVFFIISFTNAQEINPDLLSDSVLYKKILSGGVIVHTQGFGACFQKGDNVSSLKTNFYEFSFVGMKSPKQIRSINPYFTNAKSYVYGKLNSVYFLRGGIGRSHLLNRKPYFGGVELRLSYSGGASIGFAKPIYLYVINFTSNPYEYTISTEKYDEDEHFYDNIYGRAPFTEGIDETKIYPGIYGRASLSFEFGPYKSKVNTLNAGAYFEIFPQGIKIMAFTDPKRFFFNLFLSYSFGKRYNKY